MLLGGMKYLPLLPPKSETLDSTSNNLLEHFI